MKKHLWELFVLQIRAVKAERDGYMAVNNRAFNFSLQQKANELNQKAVNLTREYAKMCEAYDIPMSSDIVKPKVAPQTGAKPTVGVKADITLAKPVQTNMKLKTINEKVRADIRGDSNIPEADLTNTNGNDIITSKAISGGLNPYGKRADKHAQTYYEAVRKMKNDVSTIAKTLNMPEEEIRAIKDFVFLEKHDLGRGKLEYFEPSYQMAESWRRLIDGKPEAHDITLIKHERMERQLMREGLSQEEAHIQTSKVYNYHAESEEYYGKIKKYKQE